MSEENKPKPVRRVSRKINKSGGGRRDEVCHFIDHKPQVVTRNRTTKSTIDITESNTRPDELNNEGISRGEKNEKRRLKVTKRRNMSSLKDDSYEPCVSPRKENNHETDIVNTIHKDKFKSKISKSKPNKSETVGDNSKLLGQIEGGFKLKSTKHLMLDKSGPIISGASSSGKEQSQPKPLHNIGNNVENKLKLKINIPNGSNSVCSKVGKKPRAFSVFSLEDELKQKLNILEDKSQSKQKEKSRPPLPPKPKFSPSVEMDAAFKNSPRFRSLRNLRKKSNFQTNERIKQINDSACNKSDEEGSINDDDIDSPIPKHFKQLSNSSDYQKERIACSETNIYAKNVNQMGFSKKVPSPSDHFLENRKKLGNLFGNVSEQNLNDVSKNRDNVSANNRINNSSKSVKNVGKDLLNKPKSENKTRKPSVNTASSNGLSYNIDSEDNDISYESDDLSSNGAKYNITKTSKSNTHKINNISQSIKGNMMSSHINMRQVLQRLPSITSIKDSSDESELSEYDLDANYGINNKINDKTVGIHNHGDNNIDFKSNYKSGDDKNINSSKYKTISPFHSTNKNENKMSSQYDQMKSTDNAKKEKNMKCAHINNNDIKGPVRNEGLVKAPPKRPTCPPPLPPLLQKPKKPLSFNKDFEARFTFNDICKLPPPLPYKTSRIPTSTPTIATNQVLRFLQKPNVNIASKKSLSSDPYETTV